MNLEVMLILAILACSGLIALGCIPVDFDK
jgi:hypothetical protein